MYLVRDIATGIVVNSFKGKKEADAFCDVPELEVVPHKEAGSVSFSLSNCKEKMLSITDACPNYKVFIQGGNNFRYAIDPTYKGNRDPFGKPLHEKEIREYLIKHWGAEVVENEETDDKVSYMLAADPENICIASIDKDLDNTYGHHYNFDKEVFYYVQKEEADLNFARQLLTGDSTDNVKGIPGCGAAKALKILPHYTPEWLSIVKQAYKDNNLSEEYLTIQGQLLWMRRKPEEMWSLEYIYE